MTFMYKVLGIGLLGIFALLAFPIAQGITPIGDTPHFGGFATMVVYDSAGNEKFAQKQHNFITNAGENFIVDQVFSQGTVVIADALSVGKICVSQTVDDFATIVEGTTAAQFDTDNTNDSAAPCNVDTTSTDGGDGTLIIGDAAGIQFAVAGSLDADETIRGIGICTNGSGSPTASCVGTGGILFAAIDTGDVTVTTGDTVNINYTFDISDAGN